MGNINEFTYPFYKPSYAMMTKEDRENPVNNMNYTIVSNSQMTNKSPGT